MTAADAAGTTDTGAIAAAAADNRRNYSPHAASLNAQAAAAGVAPRNSSPIAAAAVKIPSSSAAATNGDRRAAPVPSVMAGPTVAVVVSEEQFRGVFPDWDLDDPRMRVGGTGV
jgi:hypothetical protein